MTQLKNQDPTSPLDTNQFTSELVQFSSVEQQIQTNTSLTQLIQLTQAGELMQSSAMLGRQVTVQSDHVPLQNGQGNVAIHRAGVGTGRDRRVQRFRCEDPRRVADGGQGRNSWTWDGTDNNGSHGAGRVLQGGGGGRGHRWHDSALPFTVTGTATGVTSQNNSVQLQLGALNVGFDKVRRWATDPDLPGHCRPAAPRRMLRRSVSRAPHAVPEFRGIASAVYG